ncbi:MAG TPA: hypothetical protein ENN63_10400 [Bacteroidetes bacterium]|nr:hypothetical protein [Bacteroidota bacterium]
MKNKNIDSGMNRFPLQILLALTLLTLAGCGKTPGEYVMPAEPVLSRITLTGGLWYDAMQRESEYLRSLDPDRLLVHFRKVAGIPSEAREYGGWEKGSSELRGHSIGHYLSASARMAVLANDTVLRKKCRYIVGELRKCQEKNGTGYVSAFPEEYLDRVENIQKVWAPYYTLHKILAGLFDCYLYLDDEEALETARGLVRYLYGRIIPLGKEHFQMVLDHTEQGGMNELLWNMYAETGDTVCRDLAQAFYQHSYFDSLAERKDNLKGYHANSYIPNVVGVAREYEVTGDITRRQIAEFFWEQVVNARSYVTGGTSNGEHWNTDPYHLHTELGPGAHECCCTYNMIKLSDCLWGGTKDIRYQEYMERALINGILPSQNRETRMSMYYVSMAPGYYKTWGTPDSSFWCCTGTGMENFSRIAEYLYDVHGDRLYVNQFVPSRLDYSEQGFVLVQNTDLPEGSRVEIVIESEKPVPLKIAVRIPSWTGDDYKITINKKEMKTRPSPGSYLFVDRMWNPGDRLEIDFTPVMWYSLLPVTNEYVTFGAGPLVLAARFQEADVPEDLRHRYGPYDGNPLEVPAVHFDPRNFPGQLKVVDEDKRWYRVKSTTGQEIDLVPFYDIHREYFSIYLPVEKPSGKMNQIRVDPSEHI